MNSICWRQPYSLLLFASVFGSSPVLAATIVLTPVADTSLMENWPSNNLGRQTFFISGTTQNFTKNRGLLKFDIAGNLPAGSQITSANLILECTKHPNAGYNPGYFGLHRMLKPWGEGSETSPTNCTSCIGQGMEARPNDACWLSPMAFTTNTWAQAGAAATNDYAPLPSTGEWVYTEGLAYTLLSTPEVVADLHLWHTNAAANQGWILVCGTEDLNFTARRFGSREDPNKAPLLEITYTPPLRIDRAEAIDGQFTIQLQAEAGQAYTVQYAGSLNATNNWSMLTNIPAQPVSTTVIVTDPLTPTQRVYRLVAP